MQQLVVTNAFICRLELCIMSSFQYSNMFSPLRMGVLYICDNRITMSILPPICFYHQPHAFLLQGPSYFSTSLGLLCAQKASPPSPPHILHLAYNSLEPILKLPSPPHALQPLPLQARPFMKPLFREILPYLINRALNV